MLPSAPPTHPVQQHEHTRARREERGPFDRKWKGRLALELPFSAIRRCCDYLQVLLSLPDVTSQMAPFVEAVPEKCAT
jgi:hypothetical protein